MADAMIDVSLPKNFKRWFIGILFNFQSICIYKILKDKVSFVEHFHMLFFLISISWVLSGQIRRLWYFGYVIISSFVKWFCFALWSIRMCFGYVYWERITLPCGHYIYYLKCKCYNKIKDIVLIQLLWDACYVILLTYLNISSFTMCMKEHYFKIRAF